MSNQARRDYWQEAFALQGSITPHVCWNVLLFGLFASCIWGLTLLTEHYTGMHLRLEILPFEIAGVALGLLLVLRTNAGYDRWWEARKLWGGIVNQSRNVAISALAYGPRNREWQSSFIHWTACFSHVARCSLRSELASQETSLLVGPENSELIAKSEHMPSFVSLKLALLLHQASTEMNMDKFSFLQIDKQRASLIDHIGACERIAQSPLPLVYSIKIRRYVTLFLLLLPFALLYRLDNDWLVPLITMLVANPLLSLDLIGVELQNPFQKQNLDHLPLDALSDKIEGNLKGLLATDLSELDGSH